MKNSLILMIWCLIFINNYIFCQTEGIHITIMFWNVENLFDTYDDSLVLDDEFTPGGTRHWTWDKFERKLNNLYKVISSAGGWKPPDIVGLCEIENRWVLEQLVSETPLAKYDYKIIHNDSPDPRGIDVSMLYLPGCFNYLKKESITVRGLHSADDATRDILYIKGILRTQDTINLFINHWPSRYPSPAETMHKRQAAAKTLKQKTDSLASMEPDSRIVIFGDFNEEGNENISDILGAKGVIDDIDDISLYRLSASTGKSTPGTYKYQGEWFFFDQFIVSGSLLKSLNRYTLKVFAPDFLLERDESYVGLKPFRTFNGYHYHGGFSDHLPVCLDMYFMK